MVAEASAANARLATRATPISCAKCVNLRAKRRSAGQMGAEGIVERAPRVKSARPGSVFWNVPESANRDAASATCSCSAGIALLPPLSADLASTIAVGIRSLNGTTALPTEVPTLQARIRWRVGRSVFLLAGGSNADPTDVEGRVETATPVKLVSAASACQRPTTLP